MLNVNNMFFKLCPNITHLIAIDLSEIFADVESKVTLKWQVQAAGIRPAAVL